MGHLIGGYATRHNKPHSYKGRVEVLRPGAFTKSLRDGSVIRFIEDHNDEKLLAFTGNSLCLWEDDVGLAFKARLPAIAGQRIYPEIKGGRRASMSVGYKEVSAEDHIIEGQKVRFIKEAKLLEISLIKTGSSGVVTSAFAEALSDSDSLLSQYHLTKFGADTRAACMRFGEVWHRTTEAVLKYAVKMDPHR
jgi:HK97 family phage prohead protease